MEEKNTKPIKAAIMGLVNGHTVFWYESLLLDPNIELVAVSIDLYVDRYELAKRITMQDLSFRNTDVKEVFDKVEVFSDDEEMLKAHPDIQLCIVGGSNRNHMKEFRLCAERNIHMISMKVPTMDMAEYDEMIRLKKEHNLIVHTELELRWQASVERFKELIEKGAVGKVESFCALNYSHLPIWDRWSKIPEEMYGKRVPVKQGSKIFRGGALTDHPHIFDLVRYIFNCDFETIYAEVGPNMRIDNETEDFVYINGRLKNGVIVSLDPSYANRERDNANCTGCWNWTKSPRIVQVELQANGSNGTILGDNYASDTIEAMLPDTNYLVLSTSSPLPSRQVPFLKILVNQIRTGSGDYKPEVDFEDYKKTIETVCAAYESIYTGRVVKV